MPTRLLPAVNPRLDANDPLVTEGRLIHPGTLRWLAMGAGAYKCDQDVPLTRPPASADPSCALRLSRMRTEGAGGQRVSRAA